MTDLLERLARLCLLATALLLVLVLSACGPGSGGTGTGPMHFAGEPSGTTTGSTDLVALQVEPGRVRLTEGCFTFLFEGDWAADAAGLAILHGQDVSAGQAPAPATLQLQFAGDPWDSEQVTVTVWIPQGRRIAPLLLQRRTAAASGTGCSPDPEV